MLAVVVAARCCGGGASPPWGSQWNTRVIVVPGADRVTGGPYRLIPHPPTTWRSWWRASHCRWCTSWITAVVFTVLNAALLRTRIKVENTALASLS